MNGNQIPFPQKQKPMISADELPNIICKNCGGPYFDAYLQFKMVSRLVSDSGTDEILQAPVMVCIECGTPLDLEKIDFNTQLKRLEIEDDEIIT